MYKFNRFDDRYIRPFLVYKYHKVKFRPEFELKDVLDEYQQIEDELNELDDDDDVQIDRIDSEGPDADRS